MWRSPLDVASTGLTWLAGRSTGQIPSFVYAGSGRAFWWVAEHVLTLDTPMGRKMRVRMASQGGPLIRSTMADVAKAGVQRVGRVKAFAT